VSQIGRTGTHDEFGFCVRLAFQVFDQSLGDCGSVESANPDHGSPDVSHKDSVNRMADLHLRYIRAAQVCGLLVAAAGAAALAGWGMGQPVLVNIRANYIPMAPNTALAFIVLGLGLIVAGARGRGGGFAVLGAAIVGIIALLRLMEYSIGVETAVDQWFFQVRQGRVGQAPVGKMSFSTAVAFIAASFAVLALRWQSRRPVLGHGVGACGFVTGMTGLVFSLGYLFSPDSPLLYGSQSIPMALNTSLCFVCLGIGLASVAGPSSFPLSRLSGPSIRARLLRIFLPLVVGTVGVVAWLTHLVTTFAGSSSAAISSAALAAGAIVLFGVICERIAGRVGAQIEKAESDLQLANDRLEATVAERTRALSRTNFELVEALRDSRLAHESLQETHRELKQAQSRMLQQARMASLGQTAAGVAHEINNPLAFVTNNLVLLKREFAGLHDLLRLYQQAEQTLAEYQRELYTRISNLAEEVDLPYVLENLDSLVDRSRGGLLRIQKIVADLRDFAHLEEAEFQDADLNAGISTTVRLMQNVANERQVSLEMNLAQIPRIICFPAKMNLVIQSLLSNAIDACPTGGRVAVETCGTADAIEIQVSDNGHGIPAAIQDRIFDPFFTTKPVGKGTGLGLAISFGIVKDHGGLIEFDSVPGQGTRFTIRLPNPARPRCE
jgi:two-component system, NtrC family, sensor kinase